MNTFQNQINQYEREQAKKRMGTFGGANAGTGFTNNVSGYTGIGMTSGTAPGLTSSTAVGAGELQNARQNMNRTSTSGTTATTGFTNNTGMGMTPGTSANLTSSTAVGTGEVQNVKKKMNKPSMY